MSSFAPAPRTPRLSLLRDVGQMDETRRDTQQRQVPHPETT